MECFTQTVAWESRTIHVMGRVLPLPRLTAWYGDVAYTYSNVTHQPKAWTPELLALKSGCESVAGTSFNSVLLNLYRDGRDSMSWHADDEKSLGRDPVIASVSLGTERRFLLRHRLRRDLRLTFALPHGSCLVMRGCMQEHWLHQLPKTARPIGPRINLTFRTTFTDAR